MKLYLLRQWENTDSDAYEFCVVYVESEVGYCECTI